MIALVKIPVEMCQFTKIPMTLFNPSFMLERIFPNFSPLVFFSVCIRGRSAKCPSVPRRFLAQLANGRGKIFYWLFTHFSLSGHYGEALLTEAISMKPHVELPQITEGLKGIGPPLCLDTPDSRTAEVFFLV